MNRLQLATIATCAGLVPPTLAGTTTTASDILNGVVFDIAWSASNDPFGPVVVPTPSGDITITSTADNLTNGFFEDPAVVGVFTYPPTIFGSLLAPIDPTIAPGDYNGIFTTNELLTLNLKDFPTRVVGTLLQSASRWE